MKTLPALLLLIIFSHIHMLVAADTFANKINGIEYCLSVNPTADTGMIISGSSAQGDSIVILKTDKDGMEQWRKAFASMEFLYSTNLDNFHSDIEQIGDGGYIFINTIQNVDAAIRVSKLDASGNVQWSKIYDNEGDDMSRQVLYTKDGGFLFSYSNDSTTYMVKTDNAGNEQWIKTESERTYRSFDFDICQTADSGYIFCRKENLIKYDQDGNEEWRQTYNRLLFSKVKELHSGGYVITGLGTIERTNAVGDTLWQREIEKIPIMYSLSVDRDDIILAGDKLIKMDTLANVIWQKDLPFANIRDIYTEADGSIILVGQLLNSRGFIARYSSSGESKYLILSNPQDGVRIAADSETNISWTTSGVGEIKIEWINENQNDWILLNMVADTSLVYQWTTPGSHSMYNKIRLSSVSNPGIMDENKTGFIIGAKNYDYIAINEIMMYFTTDGDGSYDRIKGYAGLFWPGGENATQTAVYEDGPLWGGLVNGDTLVNGSTYNHGLQPGNIIFLGMAADPDNPDFGVYKVRPDWESLPQGPFRERLEYDWNHWPVQLGAPWVDVNGDGVYDPQTDHPDITGDEMNWMVMNDLDSAKCASVYGAYPIGVEVQLSIYGYKSNDILKDVVFKKYRYCNKGINTIDSMYFSYWSDADLGGASDDYVGSDTLLNLLYCYNGDDEDLIYTGVPPAVGYLLIQGPLMRAAMSDSAYAFNQWRRGYKNTRMTATMLYIGGSIYNDPWLRKIEGSRQMWNNMRGRLTDGTPIINPVTGAFTNYVVPGDPVNGTGWYEGGGWNKPPDDLRMLMSSGPLTFAPGDSQEVVYAIIMARGKDRLDSVRKLKQKAAAVRAFYYTDVLPITLVENENRVTPDRFVLSQNYPNPFNPTTTIKYTIGTNYNSPIQQVLLKIYDVLGREVKTLVNKQQKAGTYKITFNASALASGVYYYKLVAGSYKRTKKMLLIR